MPMSPANPAFKATSEPMKTETNPVAPWANHLRLRYAVRTLNEQHRRTSAGFYGLGSRFFRARSRAGVLEVFDFETWVAVPESSAQFHDHNGRDISFE